MISERPAEVEARIELGHWEGDTAVSRQSKSVLAVVIERVSRLVRIKRVNGKTKVAVYEAMIEGITTFKSIPCHTLTLDNGTENCDYHEITKATGAKVYFCNPYHSWEKGAVEQVIGLIRRFLSKGTDFKKISDEEVAMVEYLINNRPRKCLNYMTPLESVALVA